MADRFVQVRVEDISVVSNVRRRFDEEKLQELTASIRENGILEPLILRVNVDDQGRSPSDYSAAVSLGGFELVCGERRYRAAKLAGLPTVPAIVKTLTREQAAKIQLLENLQRQDLDPIEEAAGFKTLLGEHGYTQERLAGELGVSQSHIANRIRLLRLPAKIQEDISRKILSPGHGMALLKLVPEKGQPSPLFGEVAKMLVEGNVPVAGAADRIYDHVSWKGRSLRLAKESWDRCAKFDYKEQCPKDCPYIVDVKGRDPLCSNPGCFDKKQKAAESEWNRTMEQRDKERRERQLREQREQAEREKRRQIEEDRKRAVAAVGDADPAVQEAGPKKIDVKAPPADPIDHYDLELANRLRNIGQAAWNALASSPYVWGWGRGEMVIARECLLPLADVLQFFIRRRDVGASQMPVQFGQSGEVHVPEQGVWIRGGDGEGECAGLSFSREMLRVGRSGTYGGMGGYVVEPRPVAPVYYRVEVANNDGSKNLRQQVVIPGQGRHLVITGGGTLLIRKELLPKLQALINQLPAFPGEVADDVETEPRSA